MPVLPALEEVPLHGRRLAYRRAGEGPTLLLVHGLTQSSATWRGLMEPLSSVATVIAPDLPGHGGSEPPDGGDHSMGALASTLRDLLFLLDTPRATLVGHSLGGGVVLQFAYQFPELVERLVLIDSGGLGRAVNPLLRAATLPGADVVIGALASRPARGTVDLALSGLRWVGLPLGTDLDEMWDGISGMGQAQARREFLRTIRASVGPAGQSVSAREKLYLAAHLPTLVIWGAEDRVIPVGHARRTHAAIPGSRLEIVKGAGHFPHLEQSEAVAALVADFLASTTPIELPRERWTEIIRTGSALGPPPPADGA